MEPQEPSAADVGLRIWPLTSLPATLCASSAPLAAQLAGEVDRVFANVRLLFSLARAPQSIEAHKVRDAQPEPVKKLLAWFSQPLHAQVQHEMQALLTALCAPVDVCRTNSSWLAIGEGTNALLADHIAALGVIGVKPADADVTALRAFLTSIVKVSFEQRPFDTMLELRMHSSSTCSALMPVKTPTNDVATGGHTSSQHRLSQFCFATLSPSTIGSAGPNLWRVVGFPSMLMERLRVRSTDDATTFVFPFRPCEPAVPASHHLMRFVPYLAPEIAAAASGPPAGDTALLDEALRPVADVWSIGVILLRLLTVDLFGAAVVSGAESAAAERTVDEVRSSERDATLRALFGEGVGGFSAPACYRFHAAIGACLRSDVETDADELVRYVATHLKSAAAQSAVIADALKFIGTCLIVDAAERWRDFCAAAEVDQWLHDHQPEVLADDDDDDDDPALVALREARLGGLHVHHLARRTKIGNVNNVADEAGASKVRVRLAEKVAAQFDEVSAVYWRWRHGLERRAVIDSTSASPRQVQHEALFAALIELLTKRTVAACHHNHQHHPSSNFGCSTLPTELLLEGTRPTLLTLVDACLTGRDGRLMAVGESLRWTIARHEHWFLDADTVRARFGNGFAGAPVAAAAARSDSLDLVFGDTARKARRRGLNTDASSPQSANGGSPLELTASFAFLKSTSSPPTSPAGASESGSTREAHEPLFLTNDVRRIVGSHEFDAEEQLRHVDALRSLLIDVELATGSGAQEAIVAKLREYLKKEAHGRIPQVVRAAVWGALLGVPSVVARKQTYDAIEKSRATCSDRQIAVDIPRCHQYSALLASTDGHEALLRVLKSWTVANPNMSYWQGNDSVCAALLSAAPHDEPLVFASLQKLVADYVPHFFSASPMDHRLSLFTHWLSYADPELSVHFATLQIRPELFAISWFLTLFAHVLPLRRIYPLWDAMIISGSRNFVVAVAIAVCCGLRTDLLAADFSAAIGLLSSAAMVQSLHTHSLVQRATAIFESLPASIASPDTSSSRAALIKTSVCAMLEARELVQSTHNLRFVIVDTRTPRELLGLSFDDDRQLVPIGGGDAISGPDAMAALMELWEVPPGAASSSSDGGGGSGGTSTKAVTRKPLIRGALLLPYDGLKGWDGATAAKLVLEAAASSEPLHHVVVVSGSEPESGQSAAQDLIRRGVARVSCVLGGVDALKREASELLVFPPPL